MKCRKVFVETLLTLIVLTIVLTACSEDIAPKEKKKMLTFTYESYFFMNSGENEIEERMVFINTKEELDVFSGLHGEMLGERFMETITKYNDSFFANNGLIWLGAGGAYTESELQSIEHIIPNEGLHDYYTFHLHTTYYVGTTVDAYLGEQGFLIEIDGKHEMTKYNTAVNKTKEEVPLSEADIEWE